MITKQIVLDMMKFKIVFVVALSLFVFKMKGQTKNERETKIAASDFPKAAIDTLMTQAEKLVINFIDGVEAGCIACNENWLNTSFEDQQTKIFQNMAFRLFAKEHALNSYQIAFLLGINRQKAKDILSLRNFVTTSLLDEFLQCSLLKIQQAKDH